MHRARQEQPCSDARQHRFGTLRFSPRKRKSQSSSTTSYSPDLRAPRWPRSQDAGESADPAAGRGTTHAEGSGHGWQRCQAATTRNVASPYQLIVFWTIEVKTLDDAHFRDGSSHLRRGDHRTPSGSSLGNRLSTGVLNVVLCCD